MGLCVVDRRNHECPVIMCDHCGEEIETVADGNYQWRFEGEEKRAAMFFTHKRCCHAFDLTHPSGGQGAMELEFLLVCLENSLKFDRKKAEERAALISSVGV